MRGSGAFRTGAAPGGALAPRWSKDRLWRAARATPSLDLNFADSKSLTDGVTGQNLVTFTRSSSATYVDSTGTLRSAVTNLLLRSEEFDNASWAKLNSVTITANAIAAPNGTITADKIVEPASSADKPVVQLVNLAASTTYTASVYFKAAERPTILFHVRKSDYSTRFGGFFNTSTNTFTAETASGGVLDSFVFRNIGNGWYQCSITGNIGANTAGIVTIYMANSSNNIIYTGDGTSGLYLWGAQLQQSTTVGEYVPTGATINSAPRFDHNPLTGESLGLLVEEQRTNSIRNNTMVGAVAGTPGTLPTNWSATTPANGITREILGTGTEDGIAYIDFRFSGTNTLGSNFYMDITFDSGAIVAAQGQSWTESIYAKLIAGSITGAAFSSVPGVVLYSTPNFDDNGSLRPVSATNARLSSQRFSVTRTLANATSTGVSPRFSWAIATGGTIDFTLRIGLPQLEQGAFATSVIPTTSATATRSADVASITGSNFARTRTNLLVRSEEFGTTWTATSATVSADTNETVSPAGVNTADKLTSAAGTAIKAVFQGFTSATGTYTFSVYAKKSTHDFIQFFYGGTGLDYANFNIATGVTGTTVGTSSIISVGNGWYRCVHTFTASSNTSANIALIDAITSARAATSTNVNSIYLWGAQLETGSIATPYIPSPSVFVSRASSATYIDSNRVLRSAVTNLLIRSDDFTIGVVWPLFGSTLPTITANASISPDASLTADLWTRSITSSSHISQSITKAATAIQYTFSVFVKQSVGNFCALRVQGVYPSRADVVFNIATGAISSAATASSGFTGASASIIPYPNNWYRLTLTAISDTSTSYQCLVSFNSNNNVIDGIDSVSNSAGFLWGAQLEQSSTVGDYVPTTTTINSAARYDFDPTTGTPKGLLLEEARTNSIRNNTMVGAVAGTPGTVPTNWTASAATNLSREVIGTGVENGINYIDFRFTGTVTAARTQYIFFETINQIAAINGQSWAGSAWLKLAGGSLTNITSVSIQADTRDSAFVYVNTPYISAISLTSTLTRFAASGVATGASVAFVQPFVQFTTAASGSIDITLRIGLPQLEQGAFATSAILTSGTAATRAADVSTSAATTVTDASWYRQDEGTVFAEARTNATHGGTNSFPRIFTLSDGTTNNTIDSYYRVLSAYTDTGYRVDVAGVNQAQFDTNNERNGQRQSIGYAANNFAFVVGGAIANTDTSGSLPVVTQLRLGARGDASIANGTIRRLVYWGQRLPNTVLQAITQ